MEAKILAKTVENLTNKNELTKKIWMGFQHVQNAVVLVHEMKEYHIKF